MDKDFKNTLEYYKAYWEQAPLQEIKDYLKTISILKSAYYTILVIIQGNPKEEAMKYAGATHELDKRTVPAFLREAKIPGLEGKL